MKKGGLYKMSMCPDFPRCRFCHFLAWSAEDQDFVCINPDYAEWDRLKKGGSSNEEMGTRTDNSRSS